MKRGTKILIWVVSCLALVVAAGFLFRASRARLDEAAFQEQLRLARLDGLPTNAAEFAASIKTAKPEENAAFYYQRLRSAPHLSGGMAGDPQVVDTDLLRSPTPANLAAAKKVLLGAGSQLSLVDSATKLPKCWFNRDWSQGAATLLPEFSYMKSASRLLALRGTVAAAAGKDDEAIRDAREVFALANHAGQEGTEISANVSDGIYVIGLHALANWAFMDRSRGDRYVAALREAAKGLPKPDIRAENRDRLFMELSVIDECETPEGRRKLGLKDEDRPAGDAIIGILTSKAKSKIALVKAERAYWAGLKLPRDEREDALTKATLKRATAMFAFPLAFRLSGELGMMGSDSDVDPNVWREESMELGRRIYNVAALALGPKSLFSPNPKAMQSGIKSPYDGKVIEVTFTGNQLIITGSRSTVEQPLVVKIPPDKPKR